MNAYTLKIIKLGQEYPQISVNNLGLLLSIYDLGKVTALELAKITGKTRPQMSEQIKRLIDRELARPVNIDGVRAVMLTQSTRIKFNEVFGYE